MLWAGVFWFVGETMWNYFGIIECIRIKEATEAEMNWQLMAF